LVDNNYFLFAGIAFLFFAFLNLMHLLGNKNMGVFPEYGNLGPTFYIAGRYLLSISLLIAPLFINRKLNTALMFAVYSVVTSLILLSILHWQIFPACIVEGVGLTLFKVVSDYVICLILLGAIGLLLLNRQSFDFRVLWIIVSSIILSIATGLTFTLYTDPFGITNMSGHLFQIASFYLIYLAFIETSVTKPQDILFRKLKQNEEKLTEHLEQLDFANDELKQEIAERKRAEKELQRVLAEAEEGRNTLNVLMEHIPTGITIADAPDVNIRMVSKYGQEVLERAESEIAHIRVFDHPSRWGIYRADGVTPGIPEDLPLTRATVKGEIVRNEEWIVTRKDGTLVPILCNAAPIRDKDGNVIGGVIGWQDITERRQAEEELRKAHDQLERRVEERTEELLTAYERLKEETSEREQAEHQLRQSQKLEALGTLAGGIAHDFNNILAVIIGFTELAQDHQPDESQEARHLKKVLEASVRGRDLVKQMLTFSRKSDQEKKPLRLSSIVKETVKLLRASVPTTIDIRTNVKSESGVILGDAVQIQQVLMNLATNAAHAMQDKGGILYIELSDFSAGRSNGSIAAIEPGPYMKLTVRDTGVGIPAGIKERIFDPFFTTKRVGKGTGLGLAVVMGIVKQSGGHITVESEPGGGSTFSVYFPMDTAGIEVVAAAGEEAIPTGSARILLVDDEEALLETGEKLLAKLGYEVTSRQSSETALADIKEDPSGFDLVITDQTMPEMTGVELAKRILELRPDLPVILCTGFSHLVDADSAKAAGIANFVMKPLTTREIAKTIRDVLDG
jgi:signal transduction histidine kinase